MESACIRFAVLCSFWVACVHIGYAKGPEHLASSSPGIILVSATVEGQPATFLLDTGAERSCLDAVFASRLRSRQTSVASIRQPYATVPADGIHISDLEIQTFHLRDFEMLSSDLARLSQGTGVPIDGVLGSDVLRHFTVRIDFFAGSARFGTYSTMPLLGTAVTLQLVHDLYFVALTAQGTPISMLLDTGTNASVVSSQAWEMVTTHWHPHSMVLGVRSTGGSEGAKFALIPMIDIGGSTSENVPFRVQPTTSDGLFTDAGFDGLLGSDVLRQYVVTLDLANNRIYLASDPNNHPDPYLFSTIGIQFARDENRKLHDHGGLVTLSCADSRSQDRGSNSCRQSAEFPYYEPGRAVAAHPRTPRNKGKSGHRFGRAQTQCTDDDKLPSLPWGNPLEKPQ
jgi:predicted aspartyl protease